MPCCSRASRSEMSDVERTSSSFKCVINTLAVFVGINVAGLVLGGAWFAALFTVLLWGTMLAIGHKGMVQKNERLLRQYATFVMCVLCCGLVVMFVTVASVSNHHSNRPDEIQGPDADPSDAQQQPMDLTQPKSAEGVKTEVAVQPLMELKDPQAEAKPMDLSEPKESETQMKDLKMVKHKKHHHGEALMYFFIMLYLMTFLALKIASVMLAMRLVRALKAERSGAVAMMAPGGKSDIALQQMPSAGSPQVFYMPTADGQPQYVVYQPVSQV